MELRSRNCPRKHVARRVGGTSPCAAVRWSVCLAWQYVQWQTAAQSRPCGGSAMGCHALLSTLVE